MTTEDPVMLFVSMELARAALISGKIWRIQYFFLSTPYSRWFQLDVRAEVEEEGSGKDGCKPQRGGQEEVCSVTPPKVPPRLRSSTKQ